MTDNPYQWRDPFAEIERADKMREALGRQQYPEGQRAEVVAGWLRSRGYTVSQGNICLENSERYRLIDAVDRVQWYALALAFCVGLLIGIWIP